MAYAGSPENDLCCSLWSPKINDSFGVFFWVKESICHGINVQGKVRGRDAKHDDCQYHHDGGADRPLSTRATMKMHKVFFPDLQLIKSNVQQVKCRGR
jgi:hypothetical protein